MGSIGVGDIATIVRCSYSVYRRVWQVAREARSHLAKLDDEVKSFKNTVRLAEIFIASQNLQPDRSLQEALDQCRDAVRDLEHLLSNYESLASAKRESRLKRLSWISEQSRIAEYVQRFKEARAALHFALDFQVKHAERSEGQMSTLWRSSTTQVDSLVSSDFQLQDVRIEYQPFDPGWYPPAHERCESTASISLPPKDNYLRITIPRPPAALPSECIERLGSSFGDHGLGDVALSTWLCIATWWLLKFRKTREILRGDPIDRDQDGSDATEGVWRPKLSASQAHADLLKSCYIVEVVILSNGASTNAINILSRAELSQLSDLTNQINDELSRIGRPDTHELLRQNLTLIEPFVHAIEEPENLLLGVDERDRSPYRFMVTDIHHAGRADEKFIFRNFVNAQFGDHGHPTRSVTAPYMLILSCLDGSSDLFISLINQQGTIYLCRTASRDDYERFEEDVRTDGGYMLNFPSQNATIKFLHARDRDVFKGHLRDVFFVLKDRHARFGEIRICRAALTSYETNHSESLIDEADIKPVAEHHGFCEALLFERTSAETWKTVRRLVICSNASSPGSNAMFCRSYWLPLSRIKVTCEDNELSAKWSDCQQCTYRGDGEYGRIYSYVYSPDRPNRGVSLHFQSSKQAAAFAEALLTPFDMPFGTRSTRMLGEFILNQDYNRTRLYELRDLDDKSDEGYLGIVTTQGSLGRCFSTDVHFLHRNTDMKIERHMVPSVTFPSLIAPHYISSVPEMAFSPDKQTPKPEFGEVVESVGFIKLSFGKEEKLDDLLQQIMGWTLKFCRKVISLKRGGLFWGTTLKNACVQLWVKPARHGVDERWRLAVRSAADSDVTWLTADIGGPSSIEGKAASARLILKELQLSEGGLIDIRECKAVPRELDDNDDDDSGTDEPNPTTTAESENAGSDVSSNNRGNVSRRNVDILFRKRKHYNEFVALLQRRARSPSGDRELVSGAEGASGVL